MKRIFIRSLATTAAMASLLVSSMAPAQTTVTTTTTADGTITEYSPRSLIVSSAGAPPIRYAFNETTTYVDELGNPVSASVVRSGLPVTVHYSQVGDALLASRVIVRRGGQTITTSTPVRTVVPAPAAAVTTTETTATGYINEFGPRAIVVRAEGNAAPLRYQAGDTTTYVDEFGSPVSVESVPSGAPVTVHYSRVGSDLVASRVVVRKAAVVPAPAVPVAPVERTTTTTTTTIRSSDDDDDE